MIFVRFSGCPLFCPWCDEPLHRDPSRARTLTARDLLDKVKYLAQGTPSLLLTGGEPLIQPDLAGLITLLRQEGGFFVALETSGVGGELPANADWITLSPKTPLPDATLLAAHEIKYIVEADPPPAKLDEIHRVSLIRDNVWVQPLAMAGEPDPAAVSRCVTLALASRGRLRLSLQLHKWIHIP